MHAKLDGKPRVRRGAPLYGGMAAALLAISAVLVPSSIAQAAQTVDVYVTCKDDGSYAWHAIGYGYTKGKAYSVSSTYSYTVSGGNGGGGSFGWDYVNSPVANSSGQVHSPTVYSEGEPDYNYVTVTVKIGSKTGKGSDSCE